MNNISANDTHKKCFSDYEIYLIKEEIRDKFIEIIEILGFNINDKNLQETPKRIAKMYVDEIFSGCFTKEPKITVFDNDKNYDEMIVYGPINLKSTCSHHWQSFFGECYIGYIPDKKVVGLSKLARIVHWFMRRPQIQEELTTQIADYIQEKLNPKGIGVVVFAQHMCTIMRGVEENNAEMITSKLLGNFHNTEVKTEFLLFVNNKRS